MKPLTSQAARAGGIGVAVFGVAFLALQALQQAVGAFNPRADVVVAIIVAVSAGTLTLDRLRSRTSERAAHREQREAMEAAMVIWDPRPLKDVAPGDLGVFPPSVEHDDRPGAGAGGDPWEGYVERDIDPRLRDALRTAPVVLVFGDARAGKTRSAAQAARDVAGDALALIPRSGDGLAKLLELRPPLDCKRAVLWLDSLERFAKVIDARTLDSLAADGFDRDQAEPRPSITVLATIREATWDRLLHADGQDGEFAKAVAARARAFRVPAQLDAVKEEPAAHELYPDAELAEGIGAALSASGKEEVAPTGGTPIPRAPAQAPPKAAASTPTTQERVTDWLIGLPRRLRESGDPWLLLPAVFCALGLVWVLGRATVNGGISEPRQPTIGEQVAGIRSKGAEVSRFSDKPNQVDFHGSGLDSWVFSFRDPDRSRADEIQVWDVVGGDELKQRFSFQPSRPAAFQWRGAADIDGDGEEEAVGGYGPTTHSGELLVPFALDWNDEAGRYEIVDLHPSPPDLDVRQSRRVRRVTAPYRVRTTYAERGGNAVSGYPSQDFTVLAEAHRLVSGYFISEPPSPAPASLDVEVEIFDMQAGSPHLRECDFRDDQPVFAQYDRSLALYNLLDDRWTAVSERRRCEPVL